MYDGDEYEDQLIGDPNQLDDLIEARDLNPLDDAELEGEDGEDQDKGDETPGKTKPKRKVVLNPQPKLDAVRLTGPRGIATIESLFRGFKFLGPGYEEKDLKRIMERLELWGNRLFPKYQFDDFLEKVEKLGQKRPVMNFVNKIRMGIVTEDSIAEDPRDEVDDADVDVGQDKGGAVSDDLFTQLMEEQLSRIESQKQQERIPSPAPQAAITNEQRERMLRNRRLAEERRLAKMKPLQEKNTHAVNPSDSSHIVNAEIPLSNNMSAESVNEISHGLSVGKAELDLVPENANNSVNVDKAVASIEEQQNSVEMETLTTQNSEGNQVFNEIL